MKVAHYISETLNDLVQICIDGDKGFSAAVELLDDAQLKRELVEFSLTRRRFASEIQALVAQEGEDPAKTGDTSAALHRGWMNVKTLISRNDRYAVLAECERGEDSAVEAYRNALNSDLPPDVSIVIQRQATEIQRAHDRIRSLRDSAKH